MIYYIISLIILIFLLSNMSSTCSEHLTNSSTITSEIMKETSSYTLYTYLNNTKYYLNSDIMKKLLLETSKDCKLIIKPLKLDKSYFMLVDNFFALDTTTYSLSLDIKTSNLSKYKFNFTSDNKIIVELDSYPYYLAANVLNVLYYDTNIKKGLVWYVEEC